MFENGVAKTRVRVTPRVRVGVRVRLRVRIRVRVKGEGKGGGENCCGNSNLDFHLKFLLQKVVLFILYISLNFTIGTSWTWRGLKTIHLPFLRESVRCTVCSSPNVTYLKDCRHIFCNMRDCGRSTIA